MLISFSGIDSAGKTTQIEMLLRYCDERGISAKRLWGKARGTPGVEFLKSLVRRERKMTQEELAEVLFVSRTAISKWESGRGYPNIESLKAISYYFQMLQRMLIYAQLNNKQFHMVLNEELIYQVLQYLLDMLFS